MHRIEIEQIADHDLGTHVAQRLRAFVFMSHHRTHRFALPGRSGAVRATTACCLCDQLISRQLSDDSVKNMILKENWLPPEDSNLHMLIQRLPDLLAAEFLRVDGLP